MNPRGKKLEPKLKLDMPFAEALERFARTDPREVDKSIEQGKTAGAADSPAGDNSDGQSQSAKAIRVKREDTPKNPRRSGRDNPNA
jgi:hypothetical protein